MTPPYGKFPFPPLCRSDKVKAKDRGKTEHEDKAKDKERDEGEDKAQASTALDPEFFPKQRINVQAGENLVKATMDDQQFCALYASDGWVNVTYDGVGPEECPGSIHRSVPVQALEKHVLAIDIGSVFLLEKGGNWNTQPEAALTATSRWQPYLTGVVDLRYSAVGAIEKPATEEEASEGEPEEEKQFNPFESGGGSFRGDFYLAIVPWPSRVSGWGLFGGAGFTTVPKTEGDEGVETRLRAFVGVRWQVFGYNAGRPADSLANTRGYFQVAYAQDNLWEWDQRIVDEDAGVDAFNHRDERHRYLIQGQIELPEIGGEYLRIAVRLDTSVPTSNNGPSDVRISALATLDPKIFRALFGGVGKVK